MNLSLEQINGILLLYKYPPGPNNLIEHVNAFEKYSRFKVWKVNTLGGFPKKLRELRFDIIVLHYSFMYTLNYDNPASDEYLEYLDSCKSSYKIAFIQDEHHTCQRRFKFINDYGVDCIYTLLEPASIPEVYGKYTKARKFIFTLPCFVSDEFVELVKRYIFTGRERPIDIGYRGRELPAYMGKGALEKSEIAYRFRELAKNLDLSLDIETGEKDRIYGNKWYRFIANCKAMLGVEAGVSIFDVDDEVKKEYDELYKKGLNPELHNVFKDFLERYENKIYYRTVSPRQFEAAAFNTCQILFEGRYSGLIKPGVHYISLKKDFCNFEDVITMFRDKSFRAELTENAYRDLIISGNYSYRKFIGRFDRELMDAGFSYEQCNVTEETVTGILDSDRLMREMKAKMKSPLYMYFPGRDLLKNLALRYFERHRSLK